MPGRLFKEIRYMIVHEVNFYGDFHPSMLYIHVRGKHCSVGLPPLCRYCGYIVDSGDNQFHFYGFHCTPNTDRLCLALHSACQARYQRVLDAHMDGDMKDSDMPMPVRSIYSSTVCTFLYLCLVYCACVCVYVQCRL